MYTILREDSISWAGFIVKTNDINSKLTLIIYYSNTIVNNLIIVNNLTKNTYKLSKSHVIYEVACTRGDCELPNPSYIDQNPK